MLVNKRKLAGYHLPFRRVSRLARRHNNRPLGELLESRIALAGDMFAYRSESACVSTADYGEGEEEAVVAIRIEAIDADSQTLSWLDIGEQFTLNIWVQDVRAVPLGVFSAYVDVTFDSEILEATGQIAIGAAFDRESSGSFDENGNLDEVGGINFVLGGDGEEILVASVPMQAIAGGLAIIASDPADLLPEHEVSIFGSNLAVPNDQINLGKLILGVGPAIATDDSFEVEFGSSSNQFDVLANDVVPPSGSTLSLESEQTNSGGVVTLIDATTIAYTPPIGFSGDDQFSYSQTSGDTVSTASVQITVNSRGIPLHNSSNRFDVDANGIVTPLDLLLVIRDINAFGSRLIPIGTESQAPFVDINADNLINPLDLIQIIRELNRLAAEGEAEGEKVITVAFPRAAEIDAVIFGEDLPDRNWLAEAAASETTAFGVKNRF